MNRLGFEPQDAHELGILLKQQHSMAVKAVFSHLVGSEAAEFDDFTHYQARLLNEACTELSSLLGYPFIKHIANSAAIFRHKDLQFDMVRLGIGLYGVDSADGNQVSLETVATLQSTIAQIRTVKAGETVSYNRKGKVSRDSQIATVRIGYADGYSRRLGNSVGSWPL
jgi:alanine racemase